MKPADGLPQCARFEALTQRIRGGGATITRESIKSALASRDNPAHPISGDFTYACTVFVLRAKPELEMAPGRPDRFAFQTFGF